METFRDIIAQWGTATALAAEIGELPVTVRAWRNRNSIPADKWLAVIQAAGRCGVIGVTPEALTTIAARRCPTETRQ